MSMMDVQLNSWLLFAHAGTHFAEVEVVSRLASGAVSYTHLTLPTICSV